MRCHLVDDKGLIPAAHGLALDPHVEEPRRNWQNVVDWLVGEVALLVHETARFQVVAARAVMFGLCQVHARIHVHHMHAHEGVRDVWIEEQTAALLDLKFDAQVLVLIPELVFKFDWRFFALEILNKIFLRGAAATTPME